MFVLAPLSSLTLPMAGLCRWSGERRDPAAWLQEESWGRQWPSDLLPGKVQSFPFPVTRFSFPGAGRETELFGDPEKLV